MSERSGQFTSTLLLSLGLIAACGAGGPTDDEAAHAGAAACPVMVDEQDCDQSQRPIVFIHGSPGSGDNFGHPALLFASNGHCAASIRAIEYNALADREAAYAEVERETSALIETLLAETGLDKVDLVAHSSGTGHASRYVAAHPERVAHYVHLAGGQLTQNPGHVPTLCLSSTGDRPVQCRTEQNEIFEDEYLDHFAVCASARSFKSMYRFLHDGKREAQYEQVQCGEPIRIEGKAISFGDNERIAGGRVEVYELGPAPRERGVPVAILPVREDGSVGPWQAERGVRYEWKQWPAEGDTRAPRYSYFEPFKRGDGLVRFLYESKGAAELPDSLRANLSDAMAAMVVRHKQGAFLFGRDRLRVDGTETLSPDSARVRATVVGLYLLDQDGDGRSGGGSVLRSTFVNGTDVFLPSDPPAFIEVEFNHATLPIPNWPSQTGGLSMVWFD